MKRFECTIKHNEESLTALAHMQYDLFCTTDRNVKTVLAIVLFVAGAVNVSKWWGMLLIAYGSYLFSSKYSAANRTAKQIFKQLNDSQGEFPYSKYIFEENKMRIITMPNDSELDPLPYSQVEGLGEDMGNFYIFKSRYGGYMIPKSGLGEDRNEFKSFIESKTGKIFRSRRTRLFGLRQWLRKRENEPYHL